MLCVPGILVIYGMLLVQCHVFCLVRKLPDVDCKTRLRSTLEQYGILPTDASNMEAAHEILDARFNSRVTAVNGRLYTHSRCLRS